MSLTLKPAQVAGAEWLAGGTRRGLADPMRAGKTVMAITAALLVGAERVAVACPAVARANWPREFARWAAGRRLEYYVESYDRIQSRRDVRAHIEALNPEVLILDECHYLKTPTAKRTRAIYGPNVTQPLMGVADYVWPLSGTLMPNHVGELFPHLRALRPELLPADARTYAGFLQRYAARVIPTKYGVRVIGIKTATRDELRGILRQVFLRRPPAAFKVTPIEWSSFTLPRDAADDAELRALEAQVQAKLEAYHERLAAGEPVREPDAETSRLRRMVGRAKVAPAAALVREELDADPRQKLVLFAYHHDVLDGLMAALARYSPVLVSGRQNDRERMAARDRFQTDPACRVFVGQIQAAGTAISLYAADTALFVEPSWVPGENEQAAARVIHPTDPRPAYARILGLADSLDDAIADTIARKARDCAQVLDNPRGGVTG